MRPRGSVPSAIAGVAVLMLLTGCSSKTNNDDLQTRQPAIAAVAPAVTTAPGGQVLPVGISIGALRYDVGTGLLAALDGTTLSLIDPTVEPPAVRTVALPAPGAALAQGWPGEILVAAPNRVIRVDVATAATTEVRVEGDARTVLLRGDGSLLIGTADGHVRSLSPSGEVLDTVSGLASADALAVADNQVAVLDRRQTLLTELDLHKDRLGLALRAGDGATNLISDRFGRLIVADTAGNELLVYTSGPLVLHQRFPVGSSPYALAYDLRSDTVWVTCTQSNEVVGFDLSTGIPKEVGRYPTVRQPNSVVIDERTGDLFVGSATGDGLQRIRADERKRGQ
jgi:DNA-binding beta-propeller fold protein YncE